MGASVEFGIVDELGDKFPVDEVKDHEEYGRRQDHRRESLTDDLIDAVLLISVEHAGREHQESVIPPLALEPVGHDDRI